MSDLDLLDFEQVRAEVLRVLLYAHPAGEELVRRAELRDCSAIHIVVLTAIGKAANLPEAVHSSRERRAEVLREKILRAEVLREKILA